MKPVITLAACLICIQLFASNKNNKIATSSNNSSDTSRMKLKITIGGKTFNAILYNNATVTAFKKRLPLSVNMKELNNNEKYVDLPGNWPANASNPGSIQAGDLMLYGSNTLVLFYTSFSTSYSYTALARMDDTTGLAGALGSGNSTVTFEIP